MDVRVATVVLTFADPMQTAFGVLRKRELLLMRLRDGDGAVGWCEAAPLEAYDGVSPAKVRAAFDKNSISLDCFKTVHGIGYIFEPPAA